MSPIVWAELKETVMMDILGVEGLSLPAEGWEVEGVEGFIVRA